MGMISSGHANSDEIRPEIAGMGEVIFNSSHLNLRLIKLARRAIGFEGRMFSPEGRSVLKGGCFRPKGDRYQEGRVLAVDIMIKGGMQRTKQRPPR